MANESNDIRQKARRVKNHILVQYLKLADRVDEKGLGDLSEKEHNKYWEMTKEFARNVIPRTQELTGEDGGPIETALSPSDKAKLTAILEGKEIPPDENATTATQTQPGSVENNANGDTPAAEIPSK